jgi:hypothetical protein
MKIWCISKRDTAIKWRALLVVDEPSLLGSVAHNIFGESPGKKVLASFNRCAIFIGSALKATMVER